MLGCPPTRIIICIFYYFFRCGDLNLKLHLPLLLGGGTTLLHQGNPNNPTGTEIPRAAIIEVLLVH